jgi:hypothetical protein
MYPEGLFLKKNLLAVPVVDDVLTIAKVAKVVNQVRDANHVIVRRIVEVKVNQKVDRDLIDIERLNSRRLNNGKVAKVGHHILHLLYSFNVCLFMYPEGLFPFSVLRHRLELDCSHLRPLPPRHVVVVDIALVHDDHVDSCTEDPPQMRHAEIFHVRPVTVAKHLLLATQPTRTIGRVVPAPNTLLRQSVAMVEVVDELYGAKRLLYGLRTGCAHIHTVHPTHKLNHLALNTQQHSARRLELCLTTFTLLEH